MSFVTDNSSAYRTRLWPLRAAAAGGGNVIDGDVEDFNSGLVYQRNNRGSGIGDKHWSVPVIQVSATNVLLRTTLRTVELPASITVR